MTLPPSPLTPHPEVNAVLDILLPGVRAALGDQFIGMVLFGSLAYGGFDRDSDVDYVVVTRAELSDDLFAALDSLHQQVALLDSWCATQLEGAYIPAASLRTFDPVRVFHIMIDRGAGERLHRMHVVEPRLQRAWWEGWVFLRHVLHEYGRTLAGPPIRTLVDPVAPDELRQAARTTLECWFEPLLEQVGELADPGYPAYAVLTMCRIFYTLEHGAVTSKQAAARWAQGWLEPRWCRLVDWAWQARSHYQDPVPPAQLDEIRLFIRYTIDRSRPARPQGDPS